MGALRGAGAACKLLEHREQGEEEGEEEGGRRREGEEERELFNPPQRDSPLNPYRELAGKSRCWKAHHTHTAVFLISSAERNLYGALEAAGAGRGVNSAKPWKCKQVSLCSERSENTTVLRTSGL